MRKPNKQDLIFIGKVLIFIAATFTLYLFIIQHFIIDNCPILDWAGGLPGGSLPHKCFGYLKFFEKNSIYLYILFLWITIVPFIGKKYLFLNKIVFITGIVIFVSVIVYLYRTTPTVFFENLPEWAQQQFSHN